MSLLYDLRQRFDAALPGPSDDFWYGPVGRRSATGVIVTPDAAVQLSTVYACTRIVSETLASCPCVIYQRQANGGRRRATEHPLYKLLNTRPNPWQTPCEFIEMMQAHVELRGNAYALKAAGPGLVIESLIPLHPDNVTVSQLPSGRMLYKVRGSNGTQNTYSQDSIMHIRGLSADGILGVSTISAGSEVVAKGLAQQEFASRVLANDSTPAGVIKHPAKLGDKAYNDFKKQWEEYQNGRNRGKTAILEHGMEYQAIGVTNRDAQLLEASAATREEICGMFRVPPHKVGILERSTNNNIEHQGIEFVTDCMAPRAARFEQRINADCIDPLAIEGEFFAEFLLEALLRGDLQTRYTAYGTARQWGWMSPNDVCRKENLNPIPPDKGGDDYLRPANMAIGGSVSEPATPALAPAPNGNASAQRLKEFALEAGNRVVHKEVTALGKLLKAAADDSEVFEKEATAFYQTHTDILAETMRISPFDAGRYTWNNLKLLLEATDRAAALTLISSVGPEALAALALGVKP